MKVDRSTRILSLITIIAITILTISFLWRETSVLTFDCKVDHEKIGDYFSSLEAICFIATLFFAVWQLSESRKARLNSTAPLLVPLQKTMEWIYANEDLILAKRSEFPPDKYFFVQKRVSSNIIDGDIEVKNLSNNVATNIESEWIFDRLKVGDIIKTRHNIPSNKELVNKDQTSVYRASAIEPTKNTSIPAPTFYFLMWSHLDSDIPYGSNDESEVPELYLNINYRDIEKVKRQVRYKVQVTASYVSVLVNFWEIPPDSK